MKYKRKHKSEKRLIPSKEEQQAALNEFMAQQGILGIDYTPCEYVPAFKKQIGTHTIVWSCNDGVQIAA